MHDLDGLVGHIYDAAVEPGRWPQVLEKLSDFLEGAATKLTFQNAKTSRSEASSVRMPPEADRTYAQYYYKTNVFLPRIAKLRAGSLVKSVRGPGGGYLLARGADGTRISDIILAVDEPIRATRCTPGAPTGCAGNKTRCLTHDLWEELGNQIHLFLCSVSLADVCQRRVLGMSGEKHRQALHA